MAKISHTKIKQPSFGEKRPKLTYTKISRFTVHRAKDVTVCVKHRAKAAAVCVIHRAKDVAVIHITKK